MAEIRVRSHLVWLDRAKLKRSHWIGRALLPLSREGIAFPMSCSGPPRGGMPQLSLHGEGGGNRPDLE